ncbi:MAG: helix-turn-helix domain-containing protein, partial [Thermodesulforhabdaceae bacterium]
LLANHFMEIIASEMGKAPLPFTEEAMEELKNLKWTGNVRELRNVIERAIILAENELVTLKTLPIEITSSKSVVDPVLPSFNLSEVERYVILKALEHHRGNKQKAAEVLGISRKTLYRKIKEYGLSS